MYLGGRKNALGFEKALWFNQTKCFVQPSHLSLLESGVILGRKGSVAWVQPLGIREERELWFQGTIPVYTIHEMITFPKTHHPSAAELGDILGGQIKQGWSLALPLIAGCSLCAKYSLLLKFISRSEKLTFCVYWVEACFVRKIYNMACFNSCCCRLIG